MKKSSWYFFTNTRLVEFMLHHDGFKLLVQLSRSKPCKLFLNLHTSFSFPLISKLPGCSVYISSSRSLWKNTVFTSTCSISIFILEARLRTTWMDDTFTTREKISSKSTPFLVPEALHHYASSVSRWTTIFSSFQFENTLVPKIPTSLMKLHQVISGVLIFECLKQDG